MEKKEFFLYWVDMPKQSRQALKVTLDVGDVVLAKTKCSGEPFSYDQLTELTNFFVEVKSLKSSEV